MKMLCRTTGEFMLYSALSGIQIESTGIGITRAGQWTSNQINQGQLQVLSSGLTDELTDREVQAVFNEFEGDIEATVEYFETSYPWDGEYPEELLIKTDLDSVIDQIRRHREEQIKVDMGAEEKAKVEAEEKAKVEAEEKAKAEAEEKAEAKKSAKTK